MPSKRLSHCGACGAVIRPTDTECRGCGLVVREALTVTPAARSGGLVARVAAQQRASLSDDDYTCGDCGGSVVERQRACPACGARLYWDNLPATPTPVAPVRRPAPRPPAAPTVAGAIKLACPSCGGMLPLPGAFDEYVQCTYCHSTLQLQSQGSGLVFSVAEQMGAVVSDRVNRHVSQEVRGVRRDLAAQRASDDARELAQVQMQLPNLRAQALDLQRRGSRAAHQAAREAYYAAEHRERELSAALGESSQVPEPGWLDTLPWRPVVFLLIVLFVLIMISTTHR